MWAYSSHFLDTAPQQTHDRKDLGENASALTPLNLTELKSITAIDILTIS